MTGFSTNELLYPLTKGDKAGHEFHGNQYRQVESEESTTRPPIGKFQFTNTELQGIAKILSQNGLREGRLADITSGEAPQSHVDLTDDAMVSMAKMLGYDKPAQGVTTRPDTPPDLYRGCTEAGAEALLHPLVKYNYGGGAWSGVGVYTATSAELASVYANPMLVEMWVDPQAKSISAQDFGTIDNARSAIDEALNQANLSPSDKDNLGRFFSFPTSRAMAMGYQMVTGANGGEVTVVLDRSILKIPVRG